MTYRLLEPDELPNDSDITCIINQKYNYLRPIRPVEDLTMDDLRLIWEEACVEGRTMFSGIQAMLKKSDELRSRPRETEKEQWIRERLKACGEMDVMWSFEDELNKTWDAAFEAGRKSND